MISLDWRNLRYVEVVRTSVQAHCQTNKQSCLLVGPCRSLQIIHRSLQIIRRSLQVSRESPSLLAAGPLVSPQLLLPVPVGPPEGCRRSLAGPLQLPRGSPSDSCGSRHVPKGPCTFKRQQGDRLIDHRQVNRLPPPLVEPVSRVIVDWLS